jgi:hypothetical protein
MKALLLVAVLQCMYDYQCPAGKVCVADQAGRGECAQSSGTTDIVNGGFDNPCVSPADCQDGFICYRARGYFDSMGKCAPDTRHERSE